MKKRSKPKSSPVPPQVEPDIAGLITTMQQQLVFLEKKMDTMIGLTSARPFEAAHQPKPFQRFDQPFRQTEVKQANGYRERIMHKAICAECNKECEVPFKPSGDRPVYCKVCFSKRKANSLFKGNIDNRPAKVEPVQESNLHKDQGGENKKSGEKKKQGAKKRKKRS